MQYPLASVASPVCGPAPSPPRRNQLGPPWQLNVGRTIYYLLLFLLLTSGFCGQRTHNYFSNIDNQCTHEIEDTLLLTLWTLPIQYNEGVGCRIVRCKDAAYSMYIIEICIVQICIMHAGAVVLEETMAMFSSGVV